ncbi:dnaJ homolog subfamily C member 22-like [Oratosquilla oratoria]|uniref:dnaJ homolog subfamily C member 22-like n=1 Tax=Oratosquilla oratoria TaxID=337810 RepID=UPI003F768B0E
MEGSSTNNKSLLLAYLLWLCGGWVALHLLYLRRDRHAFVWWCTLGGYLGVGLIRDLFRLPHYVRDVNQPDDYIMDLVKQMHKHNKPPFSLFRFVGMVLVGNSWSYLIMIAVPEEPIMGLSLKPLMHLAPLGAALAVWTIGNIGREEGSFSWALFGAYLILPLSFLIPPLETSWSSFLSTLLFYFRGRRWRRAPSTKTHACRRILKLSCCWLVFSSLWVSFFYFNAEVTDRQGERIKLRDAARNFLNSPMFLEFKNNVWRIWNDIRVHGLHIAYANFVDMLDPLGEKHALKVLGLERGAGQEEITAQYRHLAKMWHPDKYPPEQQQEAQQKFQEVAAAYEKLSDIKKRRGKKNRKSSAEAA